ncbi:hypothetical protein [Anaeromyxobacter oryzae]|uniref:hypothetical protein n=1 Tax=Anaeromyxobacter oryzae TaxID=2918170 RepID=UPI0020BEA3E2|nr:hypothetical protein [Anaeromyxobacter oryzae]
MKKRARRLKTAKNLSGFVRAKMREVETDESIPKARRAKLLLDYAKLLAKLIESAAEEEQLRRAERVLAESRAQAASSRP